MKLKTLLTTFITFTLFSLFLSSCNKKDAILVNRKTVTPEIIKEIEEEQKIKEIKEEQKERERQPSSSSMERCGICWGDISIGENCTTCTKCKNNPFHTGCINKWLENNNTCPPLQSRKFISKKGLLRT